MAEYNDDLNYPDPFYISDIETYELLHVNCLLYTSDAADE